MSKVWLQDTCAIIRYEAGVVSLKESECDRILKVGEILAAISTRVLGDQQIIGYSNASDQTQHSDKTASSLL